VKPNVPVKPFTLFVNKSAVDAGKNDRHARLTWGAAQAGVAAGVVAASQQRVLRSDEIESLLLIAAVWVNPEADDEEAVFANNEAATLAALKAGHDALPRAADILNAGPPQNPYFRT
jgi:5,6,7,8-tetrahydromethanopterin hydro-lyase